MIMVIILFANPQDSYRLAAAASDGAARGPELEFRGIVAIERFAKGV